MRLGYFIILFSDTKSMDSWLDGNLARVLPPLTDVVSGEL